MSVINLTTENFEEEVLNAKEPVLVDFWATWCGPCKSFSPIFDKVSTSNAVVDSATRKLFNKNGEMLTKGIEGKKGEFTAISEEDKAKLFPVLEFQNKYIQILLS